MYSAFNFSLLPPPPSLLSHRARTNSTRATCQSSPPWRLSTLRPGQAATGEARAPRGTLEGLNPLERKPCSHAGRHSQTTAPSPLYSDSPMATRSTPTAGWRGQRPQSNLFASHYSYSLISDTMHLFVELNKG